MTGYRSRSQAIRTQSDRGGRGGADTAFNEVGHSAGEVVVLKQCDGHGGVGVEGWEVRREAVVTQVTAGR